MPRIDFLLSADRINIISALLRAIPDDWDCLTGRLHPGPEVDIRLCDPAQTVYTVSHGTGSWAAAAARGELDPYRAFGNDGLPASVELVFAGAPGQLYDLARCKKLAMHYVQLGYVGHLEAVPRATDKRAPRAGVQFQLEPWIEPVAQRYCDVSVAQHPPLVRLFYDHLHGGNLPVLDPLLQAARRLKLLPLNE